MMVLLRFRDLKARGIVNSWPQLKRLQDLHGFPRGRMIGPNSRAWTEQEVEEWVASRPIIGPALRGIAKTKRDSRRPFDLCDGDYGRRLYEAHVRVVLARKEPPNVQKEREREFVQALEELIRAAMRA
jgi:hypothetical protein